MSTCCENLALGDFVFPQFVLVYLYFEQKCMLFLTSSLLSDCRRGLVFSLMEDKMLVSNLKIKAEQAAKVSF